MLPIIAEKLLTGIQLLSAGCEAMTTTIEGITVKLDNIEKSLSLNPILVTALNERIGYDAAAAIAKKAYVSRRSIIEVAAEETGISRAELTLLMDPGRLAKP